MNRPLELVARAIAPLLVATLGWLIAPSAMPVPRQFRRQRSRTSESRTAALAAFRRYWLLIRPFSGLVRRLWLGGVAARSERVRG
jgi:hypothetical protein